MPITERGMYTRGETGWKAAATVPGMVTDAALATIDADAGSTFRQQQDSRVVKAAGGLTVGNIAAATTPGAVVKRIEVFDSAGVSLGFIPVYAVIT